ncbi:N-acetyltransferase family protein [Deinococcus sp. UYEF24]
MKVTVRPATPADHQAVARVYTLARPGNPATASLLLAADAAQAEVGAAHARWLAEQDGEVIGAAEIMEPLGSRSPGSFWLELAVLREARGQGAATLLYRAMKAELALHLPLRLKAVVSEANPVALRFAQRRGFAEVERFWDRTLELRHFNALRHTRPLPEGLELVTLTQFAARVPDVVAALHPLYEEARADLPRSPGEAYTPMPPSALTGWLSHLDPALFALALRGDVPVGFTALEPSGATGPADPATGNTGLLTARSGPAHDPAKYELMIAMTGVARAERNRGLARALKVGSMQAAKQAGWAVIRTSNHSGNMGMLKVNDALGFGREPARLGMLREVAVGEKV